MWWSDDLPVPPSGVPPSHSSTEVRRLWVPGDTNVTQFTGVYLAPIEVPVAQRRSPGRPRKNPIQTTAPVTTPTPQVVKRGPGRPPKALKASQRDQRVYEILGFVKTGELGITVAANRLRDLYTK